MIFIFCHPALLSYSSENFNIVLWALEQKLEWVMDWSEDPIYTVMTTRAPAVPKTHYQNSPIPDVWEWGGNEKCLLPKFGNGNWRLSFQ